MLDNWCIGGIDESTRARIIESARKSFEQTLESEIKSEVRRLGYDLSRSAVQEAKNLLDEEALKQKAKRTAMSILEASIEDIVDKEVNRIVSNIITRLKRADSW